MHRSVLLLVAVLALAACGSGASAGAGDVEGRWQFSGGTADGAALPQPSGARATLDLDGGEAGGVSFCNHYFSSYRISGTSFSVDGLGGTEMGCEPDVMAAERVYLAALGTVDTAVTDGEALVLTGDGVELRFTRVTPVPESELTGTRWTLETLLDGETASSTVGEPATLELSDDGTLTGSTGSTGCRDLTGRFRIEGDVVRLTDLRAGTEDCPADVAAQDGHVVTVLGDGFQVSVDGDRLTLSDPDGRGLVYRAT
ncbi:heat shock protein HslJ [Blastococcus colisei]|uniref:Heat shock protein HslJ n=1 Tax=Blastococcus colisei TaxID=1564162 RepID=A0A543PBG3_9ACTN|nr:META domain-containing protein [Blastococcus colisei]TQN41412.1 heat shock protein HslJ [Blastococcus colisei]